MESPRIAIVIKKKDHPLIMVAVMVKKLFKITSLFVLKVILLLMFSTCQNETGGESDLTFFLLGQMSAGNLGQTSGASSAPVFSPSAGSYNSDTIITITCSSVGATIYYTTDGTSPTMNSNIYSGPISLAGDGTSVTIQAFAVLEDSQISNVSYGTFEIDYSRVSTPQFSPDADSYTSDQSISITSDTQNVTIYYTTDGTSPTTNSNVYSAPITLTGQNGSTTLLALAVKDGMADSTLGRAVYSIVYPQVKTPTFSLPGGTYGNDQSVEIETDTTGATIYYTTDGTTPTEASTLYSSAISVREDGTEITIRAIAVMDNYTDSNVASATYSIDYNRVSAPVFSPAAGSFTSDQSVSLSSDTASATIYYTTDGSTPSSSSLVYSAPISVAGNGTSKTIKAIAVKSGLMDSTIAEATYTIAYEPASTPVFTPTGGTYSTDRSVEISSFTSGATIYYTTDGSVPTSLSNLYSSPISVAGNGTSVTIRAIAVADGYSESSVKTATFTISYATVSAPEFSITEGTYTMDQSVDISTATSGATIYYTVDGSTPTTGSTEYTGAISVAGNGTSKTIKAIAVKSGMNNSNVASALYTIAYPAAPAPLFSSASGTFTYDLNVSITSSLSGATIYYTTDGSTPTTSSAVYASPIAVAGHGTSMTIKAIVTATDYSTSPVSSSSYTIQYNQVSTPTFSPTGTAYSYEVDVTISTYTSGTTIYYTTDGSTPTTSSSVYTGPVHVSGNGVTTVIKAFAVKSGMVDSSVATKSITIDLPPSVLSSTPSDGETDVNLETMSIVITFDEAMNTSLIPDYTIKVKDLTTPINTTGAVVSWNDSTHLQISLPWVHLPEYATIQWVLSKTNVQDLGGESMSADASGTFTAEVRNTYFPISDTGVTLCYNDSTTLTCGDTTYPGQDGDYLNIPAAISFTGPVAHSTYTDDYTTTDNVTGLIWKSCTEGMSGSSCIDGTAVNMTWYDAVNACSYLNSMNSGNGYAGYTTWRLATIAELESLIDYTAYNPAINTVAFPASFPDYYWSSTASLVGFRTVNFSSGMTLFSYNNSPYNFYARCVTGP